MARAAAATSISKIIKTRSAGGGGGSIFFSLITKSDCRNYSSAAAAVVADTSISQATPSSTTSPSSPYSEKHNKGSGLSKWLLFLPGAITFGLGTWQIFRREHKIKMLDYRQKRLAMEPLNFNDIYPSINEWDDLEFRRVVCNGVFDERKSIYVGPRSRNVSGVTENGYYVITPLMPIANNPNCVQTPILVNRGWVPRGWKDRYLEASQDPESSSADASSLSAQRKEQGSWWKFWSKAPKTMENENQPSQTPVKVVGVVRGSEKPSIFVPENDPSSSQWFYVDVNAIARACGLPENTVYVEDVNDNVNPSNPYPLPKDAGSLIRSSVMPQDHLNYTLTWYSLSAAVTFMAYKRIKPRKNRS